VRLVVRSRASSSMHHRPVFRLSVRRPDHAPFSETLFLVSGLSSASSSSSFLFLNSSTVALLEARLAPSGLSTLFLVTSEQGRVSQKRSKAKREKRTEITMAGLERQWGSMELRTYLGKSNLAIVTR
jgi:hypothetical protein